MDLETFAKFEDKLLEVDISTVYDVIKVNADFIVFKSCFIRNLCEKSISCIFH